MIELNDQVNWRPDHIPPRTLWRLAQKQCGLGALARTLLGDAAANLAVRRLRQNGVFRQRRRAEGAGGQLPRKPWTSTARISTISSLSAPTAAAKCGASQKWRTYGSIQAAPIPPSGMPPLKTSRNGARITPPISSPKPSTRRAAGSTTCLRQERSFTTSRHTAIASALSLFWAKTDRR